MEKTFLGQKKSFILVISLILLVQFTQAKPKDLDTIRTENTVANKRSSQALKQLDDYSLKKAVDSFIRYHLLLKHKELLNLQNKKDIVQNYNILQAFLNLYLSENKGNADKLKLFIRNLLHE